MQQKFGFYTAAWCVADNWNINLDGNKTASELAMRNSVPFEILGKSALENGSSSQITIVMLEGYKYLSKDYIDELEKLNFRMINYEEKFREIVSLFPNIDKKYNVFERNCFLRWLAFKDLAQKDHVSHFLHIDSDMVLYSSLEEIAKETENKTFMLEGCPAFTSISDFNWFNIYETEINKFEKDISKYSDEATEAKKLLPENNLEICNTAVWRNPLGSDQDLLEYLVSTEKISQNKSEEIFNSKFFFIQNPLLIKYWAEKQGVMTREKMTEKDGQIFYGTKRIPFTHYQGTFCYYANIFIIAHEFFPFNLFGLEKYLYYKIDKTKFRLPKIAIYLWKVAKIFGWRMDRTEFVKFMEKRNSNGQKRITIVLNFIASSEKNLFIIEKEN